MFSGATRHSVSHCSPLSPRSPTTPRTKTSIGIVSALWKDGDKSPLGATHRQWDIVLPGCGPAQPLGVDFHFMAVKADRTAGPITTDDGHMTVKSINDGAVAAFNEAYPHKALQPGDRVISINGFINNADVLAALKELSQRPVDVTMSVWRPTWWSVTLGVRNGLGVALAMHSFEKEYLTVLKVKDGETMAAYNEAHPQTAVKAGDRLMLPFDKIGTGQDVLTAIKTASTCGTEVTLVVERLG